MTVYTSSSNRVYRKISALPNYNRIFIPVFGPAYRNTGTPSGNLFFFFNIPPEHNMCFKKDFHARRAHTSHAATVKNSKYQTRNSKQE